MEPDAVVISGEQEAAYARVTGRSRHDELRQIKRELRDSEFYGLANSRIKWLLDELAAAEARAEKLEQVLRELASVPNAGPYPNKGACAAFAKYVQDTACAALAAAAGDSGEQEAAQAASSEPEHRREAGHLPGGSPVSHSGSGSLGAEADAALIRETLTRIYAGSSGGWRVPHAHASAALAALDRLLEDERAAKSGEARR